MNILRQSTSVDVPIGPFLDSGDGNTVEGSLTITQPDVRLKKNGGNWAQKNAAQTLSHEENGWYEVTLDATDTDTVGHLMVAVHEAGALPVWREFQVVEEAIYDALFAASATGLLPANVTQWLGQAVAAVSVNGVPEVDVTHVAGSTTSVSTLATSIATLLEAIGTITDAAADGDPTTSDTLVAYVKQVINVLIGTAGIVAYPAAAAPGNGVSLAEVVRRLYDDLVVVDGNVDDIETAVGGLNDISVADILGAPYEGTETVRDVLRLLRATQVGLLSGAGTTEITILGADETTERIVATVDEAGNRTAVTVDPSDPE